MAVWTVEETEEGGEWSEKAALFTAVIVEEQRIL